MAWKMQSMLHSMINLDYELTTMQLNATETASVNLIPDSKLR